MKIALCIPIYDGARPLFTQCLARMISQTYMADISGPAGKVEPVIETFVRSTPSIAYSRRSLARDALEWQADWVLWLDCDMTFPPSALLRLLSHGKPIVAANYRSRHSAGPLSTAAKGDGDPKPIEPRREGLEEVDYCGLGLCVTAAPVLRAVPLPMFLEGVGPDGFTPTGEDCYFFAAARAAGFPALVDHGLSAEVGHVSETVLRF